MAKGTTFLGLIFFFFGIQITIEILNLIELNECTFHFVN